MIILFMIKSYPLSKNPVFFSDISLFIKEIVLEQKTAEFTLSNFLINVKF